MRRVALLAAGVLLALGAGGTVPAHAHTDVLAVWPQDGASVAAPLEQVAVRFAAPVVADHSVVRVDCGGLEAAGAPRTVGSDLVVTSVHSAAPGDRCRMEFSALAADGHRIDGATTFAVAGAGQRGAAAPRWVSDAAREVDSAPRPGSGPGQPELWVLGLGLGALALALLRGRRTPQITRSGQSQITRSGQSQITRSGQSQITRSGQ